MKESPFIVWLHNIQCITMLRSYHVIELFFVKCSCQRNSVIVQLFIHPKVYIRLRPFHRIVWIVLRQLSKKLFEKTFCKCFIFLIYVNVVIANVN